MPFTKKKGDFCEDTQINEKKDHGLFGAYDKCTVVLRDFIRTIII